MTIVINSSHNTRVDLFKIDLSEFGETSLYLVQARDGDSTTNSTVTFGTQVYTDHPIEISGITSGGRSLARPKLIMGNAGRPFSTLRTTKHWRGAQVTRFSTLRKHLADGDDPDVMKRTPDEVWTITACETDSNTQLVFSLRASIDNAKARTPNFPITKNYCPLIYRTHNGTSFEYSTSRLACPYTGNNYFNEKNESVTAAGDDQCSKTVRGCRLRFPGNQSLPFSGFPGLKNTRN